MEHRPGLRALGVDDEAQLGERHLLPFPNDLGAVDRDAVDPLMPQRLGTSEGGGVPNEDCRVGQPTFTIRLRRVVRLGLV